jgi:hypothetical protein
MRFQHKTNAAAHGESVADGSARDQVEAVAHGVDLGACNPGLVAQAQEFPPSVEVCGEVRREAPALVHRPGLGR